MRGPRTCAAVGLLAAFAVAIGAPFAVAATDLPGVLTEYTVTSWGQQDGFPLGNTWAIAQDDDGYLWLGTDAGLFRFDGVRFVPGHPPRPSRPCAARSDRCLSARDGSLWIGYGEAGRAVRVQDDAPGFTARPKGCRGRR